MVEVLIVVILGWFLVVSFFIVNRNGIFFLLGKRIVMVWKLILYFLLNVNELFLLNISLFVIWFKVEVYCVSFFFWINFVFWCLLVGFFLMK